MQRTFGETFGLDETVDGPYIPVGTVRCSNGELRDVGDALRDAAGRYHADDVAEFEANSDYVQSLLDDHCKYLEGYYTSGDYGWDYGYLVDEVENKWDGPIAEWLQDNGYDRFDDKTVKALIYEIKFRLEANDCEAEYCNSDYCSYSGDGCCLFSMSLDECEDQISFEYFPGFEQLHSEGKLDEILDCISGDWYISSHNGTHVSGGSYPCMYMYVTPGGQWQYVVPAARMREIVAESIVRLCWGK